MNGEGLVKFLQCAWISFAFSSGPSRHRYQTDANQYGVVISPIPEPMPHTQSGPRRAIMTKAFVAAIRHAFVELRMLIFAYLNHRQPAKF